MRTQINASLPFFPFFKFEGYFRSPQRRRLYSIFVNEIMQGGSLFDGSHNGAVGAIGGKPQKLSVNPTTRRGGKVERRAAAIVSLRLQPSSLVDVLSKDVGKVLTCASRSCDRVAAGASGLLHASVKNIHK